MQAPRPFHTAGHGPLNRRQWLGLAALPALLSWQACTAGQDDADNTTDTWAPVRRRWTAQTWLLLGEVHDNVTQHRLRHDLLQSLVENGWRPVLLMEQFDREQQGVIDAAMRQPGASAQSIVDTAGRSGGWDWPQYLPFVDLALRHGLPIVAANVSRADARRVMADGLKAHGFDDALPADVQRALGQDILASHCGAIPEQLAQRMVLAQVARDQFMARALAQHGAQGAVLLAGNGHVRKDIGVPRWLPPQARQRTLSVGLLEAGGTQRSAYDEVIVTAPPARPDPCADFKPPATPQPAASSRP